MQTTTVDTRKIIIFLFSFICFTSYGQSTEKYQGLLWEITGNGMKKPSYLYGTMHVSNKVAFHLSDTFYLGIKNCDVVALELNPDTWIGDMMNSSLYSSLLSLQMYGNNTNLYKSFYVNTPSNKSLKTVLSKDHHFANYFLYRFNGSKGNFEENTYLDLFIFQSGKKLKKKIVGLENFEETMKLSIQASMPDEDHAYRKKYEGILEKGVDVYSLMDEAYRKGDLTMLDSITRMLSPTKNYHEFLINRRNKIMANNIDSIMHQYALFSGIGAAHLPGDQGVIQLLRKKGYKVRPVTNVATKASGGMKEKIEKTIYTLTYNTQTASDSSFQVDLPGKMFENSMQPGTKEYFCPEMVNGAYYSITKLNSFAPLAGIDDSYIYKKIDSLLYEAIPGKILKKNEILVNGNKGFDILNKTRRGDVERYQIFVSPLEIFVFKMGGTGEFVKSKESEKFFGSIKFLNNDNTPGQTYTSAKGAFKIDLPGKPLEENISIRGRGKNPVYLLQSFEKGSHNYHFVMKTWYHDFKYIEEDTFELSQLARNFHSDLGYKILEKKQLKFNNYPSLYLKLSKGDRTLTLHTIIKGPHYYLIGTTSPDSLANNKFFNSFSFTDFTYDKNFEEYTDTTLLFKVKTPVKPEGSDNFMASMEKAYIKKGEVDKLDIYRSKKESAEFFVRETHERIVVQYLKFEASKSFKDLNELWDKRINILKDGNSLMVRNKKINDLKKQQELYLLLTDTNSTRAIKARLILKNNVLYTILANVDTIGKESLFVQTFFETFQPLDSNNDESVFANKANKFFKTLEKGDSSEVAYAFESLRRIKFENGHAPTIIKIIRDGSIFKKYSKNTADKGNLITKLGALQDPTITPFLEKLYGAAGDTTTLQLSILEALAYQRNSKAYKTITKLLNQNTPLADEDDIQYLFGVLEDSLVLAKELFPDMLQFVRYPEYKENIYTLLASLRDNNYIKPDQYIAFKATILREAKEELKRQMAIEEKANPDLIDSYNYEDSEEDEDYGDTDYVMKDFKDKSFITESMLEVYSTLLIPFYQEAQVKSYFTKLDRTKNKMLKLSIAMLSLKNNIPVADTTLKGFASNDNLRVQLYKSLSKINKIELFNAKYKDEVSMAKGILYETDALDEKDSVLFLFRKDIILKGKKESVYFYKRKNESSEDWKLDYVCLKTTNIVGSVLDATFTRKSLQLPEGVKEEETIDKTLKDISMRGRKRFIQDRYFVESEEYE